MPVLALDTATRSQSAAVVSSGRLLAASGLDAASSHATSLFDTIERVLETAKISTLGLSALAVTSGPGSFTGVRIGMATAKGLALAADLPLAGFSTLGVLAAALAGSPAARGEAPKDSSVVVCALLEAGRGQVYRGIYRVEGLREGFDFPRLLDPETICLPESAAEGVESGWLVGGDGATRYRDRIVPRLPAGARLLDQVPPLAPALALLAEAIHLRGRYGEHPLSPNYIRPPDAVTSSRS